MGMINGVLPKIHGVKRKINKIVNTPEISKISVERSKDILDYFGISSTDKDLIQYIEQEVLWRALTIKDHIEYTNYPYSFDVVVCFLCC